MIQGQSKSKLKRDEKTVRFFDPETYLKDFENWISEHMQEKFDEVHSALEDL